jgi:hypothetical protein
MTVAQVPASRSLPNVLRAMLDQPGGVELLVCEFGSPLSGSEALAYANVVIKGSELKVPKLNGAVAALGTPAYVLASRDFLLCLGAVSTAAVQVAVEGYHMVGTAGQPAFGAGWSSFSGRPVGFYKDPFGVVRLVGAAALSGGTGASVFVLPAGYRPSVTRGYNFPAAGGALGTLEVAASGAVGVTGTNPAGATGFVGLDAITFRADQ